MRESSETPPRNCLRRCVQLGRAAASARILARTTSSVASLTLSRASSSSLVLSIQDGIFANAHYHGTPRFLLGMQVLLFLSRPLVIMTWCKMWDLGFGAADAANPYGQMEDAMPAPPPAAPPAGGAGYAGGGDGYKPYGVPDGNPSLGQGGGAYVPPAAAQQ